MKTEYRNAKVSLYWVDGRKNFKNRPNNGNVLSVVNTQATFVGPSNLWEPMDTRPKMTSPH